VRPEDVYALTGVAEPRISPDGSRVAYSLWWIDRDANEYRGAIWVASLDGSVEPRQFTSGERRDASPRWSPDGRWLAFTSSRGAEKKQPPQLYVMPADGGEARKLTDAKEGVESIAWSPDSTRIAYAMRVRDPSYDEEEDSKRPPRRFRRVFYKLDSVGWTGDRRKHVFVVDLAGGEPRQLTDGDCEDDGPVWSGDGSRIYFSSARGERWDVELISRVYEVDAGGGEPRQLTGDEGSYSQLAVSPDGSRIAYLFDLEDGTFPHHTQVGVMNADGGDRCLLTTSLDRQCGPYPLLRPPAWDGDRLVFTAEDRGNVHVYAVPADGSAEPELLVGGERLVGLFDALDGRLVYTASTHTMPLELFAAAERRLTRHSDSFVEGRDLVEPERFLARNGDGTEIDAWLARPVGFEEGKRYPLLLTIHGGPFAQYSTGFFDEVQVYAGAGYAVLFSNPRGGSGRSEEWGRAIRGPIGDAGPGWGSVDYADLMAVVDSALERFEFLDPERMGVLGGSYGGYMTSWIVGHTNRFKAALSERAVNHLVSAFGSSDLFWVFERQFGGPMIDHVDAWLRRSPALYAKQIETPLLIVHSEDDLRCDIEQGEHLFTLLRLLGKEVEMLRFPGESHELSRSGSPLHRVQRFEAILEWFGRYLASAE
jgi:dipeptidyl aminopeptidase/acylaminoacyl peptidase